MTGEHEGFLERLFADPDRRRLERIERGIELLLKQGNIEMATLDDIVADEAALKTANKQLIQLVGNAVAEIGSLLNGQVSSDPVGAQAKIDQLHQALVADLGDVTSAITADGSAITPPPPAPVAAAPAPDPNAPAADPAQQPTA